MGSFKALPAVRRCSVAALLSALALTAAPASAQAQDPAPEEGADARRYFDAAQKAFAEGRFIDAARAFEEAFRIKPHPAPLINAGDAWEKAGEYALAARTFQRVLSLEQATEQDRVDAIDRLARLRPQLGIIELVGDKKMRVKVDDEEFVGGDKVYVFPGEHRVSLVDVEGAGVRALNVAANTTRSVELSSLLDAKSDEAEGSGGAQGTFDAGADTSRAGGIRPITMVALGVAVVGGAGAVYFGLQTNSAESSFNDNPNRDDYDSFNQNKLFTNISLGVAVVGAGIGALFLVQDLKRGKSAATAPKRGFSSFDVAPLRGGAAVFSGGHF